MGYFISCYGIEQQNVPPVLQSQYMHRYVILAVLVVLLSGVFHAFPLPWHIIYSDITAFSDSARAPTFPYLEERIEYPVLTGLFIKTMGALGGTHQGYYWLSVMLLALMAAATTVILFRLLPANARIRLFPYWILTPSLLIFGVMNWDLLVLLPVALALLAMERKRYASAAIFLAIGFSTKFYPVIYLLPLFIAAPGLRERLKALGAFLATTFVINAPFAFVNLSGWAYFFTFNASRLPNPDSFWGVLKLFIPALDPRFITSFSSVLFIGGALWLSWRFRSAPPLRLMALLTILFLLTNKVFSPQYALWLLPFFVLLPNISRRTFYAFEFTNFAVFFFTLSIIFTGIQTAFPGAAGVLVALVFMRHAALIALAIPLVRMPASGMQTREKTA